MTNKFDLENEVLPLKFRCLGCPMVTLRSETLLYMSTPHREIALAHARVLIPQLRNGARSRAVWHGWRALDFDVSRRRHCNSRQIFCSFVIL